TSLDKPKAAGPSGSCLLGDLPLLEDPDGVAEGVADAHVGAIEVVGGLLGKVGDAARLEGVVQTPDVVRLEHESAQRAFRDQLAELRSGGFVMHRRARLLEGDLGDVARDAHRQPAVGTLLDVLALLQPELVDVEVKSLVLVEDHDGGDVEFGDHRWFSPLRDLIGDAPHARRPSLRRRLQNCSIAAPPPPPPPAASPTSGSSWGPPSVHYPRDSSTAPRRRSPGTCG